MADLLTQWLSRDIEKELSSGIDWLKLAEKAKREEEEDGGKLPYEDDGSNLRIPVSHDVEKRRCVQIQKIIHLKPRFEVMLSDSYASIPAKLTSSCVKHFENQHKRRIFDDTEYGILSIREFNIVATPYGEPTWQLSLLVDSMEWQGDFERQFGHPESIRKNPDVEMQLKKLSDFRQCGNGTTTVPGETAGTPGSRHLEPSPEAAEAIENDDMESSALFTQMQPSTQRPIPRRVEFGATERHSVGGVNRHSPTLVGNVRSAPMIQYHDEQPRKDPKVSKVDTLLSLLRAGGQTSHRANDSSNVPNANPLRNDFMPLSEENANGSVLAGRRSSGRGANVQRSPSVQSIPIRSSPPKSSSPPSRPFSNEAHREVPPTQRLLDEVLSVPETIGMPAWKYGYSKTQDQCSYPLGQAAILDRDTSLFPSLPGKTFPRPNVPTPLLASLNKRADEERSQDSGEQDHASNISEASDVEQGYDSEYDSSSSASGSSVSAESAISGWATTPPRPPTHLLAGLPPDSSAPRVETPPRNSPREMSLSSTHPRTALPPDSSVPQEDSPVRRGPSGLPQETPIELIESDSDGRGAPGRTQISVSEPESRVNPAIPSSPPEPASQANQTSSPERIDISDSEEEMEFAVSEVLEVDKVNTQSASRATCTSPHHREARGVPELQVKETPQLEGHRKIQRDLTKPSSSWSPARQRSSGQTTSSTSVIPSTYVEPRGQLNARPIATKNNSVMIDLSSDTNDLMIDEQLNAEINAASQRLPPEVQSPSPDRPKALSTSNHSPTLAPHASSSNPSSLVKRKAADLPTGVNSSKKPRSVGLGLPRDSDMANGDNKAPPMTIREQRRQKLNSYSTTSPIHAEEHLLPSPRFGTNRRESNRLVDKHISTPNHRPSPARALPRSNNTSPRDRPRDSERGLRHDNRSPAVEGGPSKTAAHMSSRPANRSAVTENASTNPGKPPQSPSAVVFSTFSQAYPEYKGTMKQFVGMCKQIQKLEDERKRLPKFLWDDYVIRYEMEFVDYRNECFENGDEPVSYYEFYDSINEHKFKKQVLDPEGLKLVLEQTSTTSNSTAFTLPVRRPPPSPAESSNPKRTRKSLPWQPSSTAPALEGGRPRMSLPSTPSQQPRSKPTPFVAKDKNDRSKLKARTHGRVDEEAHREVRPETYSRAYGQDRPNATTTTHGQADERDLLRGSVDNHEYKDAVEAGDGPTGIEMHEDPDSNFRQFVRAYASLPAVKGRLGEPDSEGFLRPRRAKRIDVMAWPIGFKR